ncbi:hypothetical protein [Pseudomonas benzenivorans]|uniref:Uncharacterized protein n=1 Tax=Pseudomonas benzenivorans TaxID=556533 RepID=A0ABY5H5K4_9PSED|nr:hypothetical protein [Pseudomonas benzenivorans]UTW07076.1 hypothetical protein KDW96_18205 [Pseudomonas benzenivorans]
MILTPKSDDLPSSTLNAKPVVQASKPTLRALLDEPSAKTAQNQADSLASAKQRKQGTKNLCNGQLTPGQEASLLFFADGRKRRLN